MASRSQSSDGLGIVEAIAGEKPFHAGPLNLSDHQPAAYQPSPAFQPNASAITLAFSSDAEAPGTAPVTNPSGWATKEAWRQHQAVIQQLYVHEGKTLVQVMRLMEDKYGFRATVRMYKMHIKQWGLDKKNKDFEMRAIVRKYKQREDQGKGSIIRIRGQVRDYKEFTRYYNRKGISIDDIIARQTSSPTPEAVELSTPVPSPITTPQVLAIPERIFCCIRDYFKGSFESGTWVSIEPTSLCYSIKVGGKGDSTNQLDYLCFLACSLFSRGLSHEARQNLIVATATINEILLADHPETLNALFRLIVSFRRQKTDELSLFLLRQFSALTKRLLGSEHPLSRICEWSGSVDASEFEIIAIRCMECMADHFQGSAGPMHMSTLSARLDLIPIIAHRREARIRMLQQLLGECEKTLWQDDVRILYIRGDIAANYLNGGYYAEAKTLIQKSIACTQDLSSINAGSYGHDHDLYLLARCQYALGEVDLGIANLRKAINSRISTWGPQDSRARRWLLHLEDWYLEQGFWDSAAQAREMGQEFLESIDTDWLNAVPIPLDGTNAFLPTSSIDNFDDSTN